MSQQVQQFISAVTSSVVPVGYKGSPLIEKAAQEVEAAVVEKATAVADGLRAIAHREGLSESLVENALIEVGLADAPVPATPETLEEKVERLLSQQDEQGKQIAALISAAKSYAPSYFRSL